MDKKKKFIKKKKKDELKKYKFPLQMFVVFEKIKPIIYTSSNLTKNHYVLFIDQNWYLPINIFLKKEMFHKNSTLTEISAIDTFKYNSMFPELDIIKKNRLILYNIYYIHNIKVRLSLILSLTKQVQTIEKIFKNANWLEREVSEMYGINFINKKDCRPLLLDYSKNEKPMLKDFPSEGINDIYYNFFENKLSFVKNEFVEL